MTQAYDIIKTPDPVLKETSHVIENINGDIKTQAERMIETLDQAGGIGLAANQVGIANRLILIDVPEGCWRYGPENQQGVLTIESAHRDEGEEKPNLITMINPEIVQVSEEKSVYFEGCLSIPEHYANVVRPAHITVRYQDLEGNTYETQFSGLDSHCVQHEIDHLNGILFIDHLSSLKRNMIVKKFKKQNRIL